MSYFCLTLFSGINSFGHRAELSDVSVKGSGGNGGSEYIVSPLKTTLNNPSNITLNTIGISLPVIYNSVKIGRAVVDVCRCHTSSPFTQTNLPLHNSHLTLSLVLMSRIRNSVISRMTLIIPLLRSAYGLCVRLRN
jgi:hypothetical protein